MDNKLSEKLKTIAEKVLKQAKIPNNEKFGSIIAILMVISIVLTVVRILQECNKNKTKNMTEENKYAVYAENIRSYSKKRGWFTRLRIKRIVKKELTQDEYNQYGIKLTEALLDIGETLKDDEVITLMEAANV